MVTTVKRDAVHCHVTHSLLVSPFASLCPRARRFRNSMVQPQNNRSHQLNVLYFSSLHSTIAQIRAMRALSTCSTTTSVRAAASSATSTTRTQQQAASWRRLVYSLQHNDNSGDDDTVSVKPWNVAAVNSAATKTTRPASAPSRSCPRRSYSPLCTVATESSLSPASGGVVGRRVTGNNNRVKRVATIALVVVVGVIMAMMTVVELGMGEEFQVPT